MRGSTIGSRERNSLASSVSHGIRATAGTVTSAAIIMVVVFAIFATTGVPQVKEIGLGLAVAIALDATLVRMVLVPATMSLLGHWNWWLPGWLDRRLPAVRVEADGDEPAPERELVGV